MLWFLLQLQVPLPENNVCKFSTTDFTFLTIFTSLLLGGDAGSPPGGDKLGGLSSLLGGSAGAAVTWLWWSGTREGGRVSGRSMLFLRNTTKCIAVLNSSRDRAPSLVTSASCLKRNIYLLFESIHNYCQGHYIIEIDFIQMT
jgi:hypothetical protein